MKTNRLFLYVLCCLAFLTAIPYLVADAVQKVQVNTDSAQTLSNKTLDSSNTYNGGTFNSQTLGSPTFTTPTWSAGAFTLTPITANSLLYANASKQLSGFTLTNGQLLIGSTGAAPVAATLTGTANRVTVSTGAGSITLSGPQDLHSGASPTFAGLTLSGIATNQILQTNGSNAIVALSSAIPIANGGTALTSTPTAGQLLIGNGTGYTLATLTAGASTQITNAAGSITIAAMPRGYIQGYTLSTPGSSATMNITGGQATDSANSVVINLAASISKTTAAWSVGTGNGCLDTGAIGTNTWYHFYAILRTDTGVSDILCSTSASSPTMPASYTKARRIGSAKTNGSSQWITFTQLEDEFLWNDAVLDVNSTNPGTAAVSSTLSVPTGVKVIALMNQVLVTGAGGAVVGLVSSPDQTDAAASLTALPLGNIYVPASTSAANRIEIRTNTSAQIRRRLSFSDANVIHRIATLGWIDPRGKES